MSDTSKSVYSPAQLALHNELEKSLAPRPPTAIYEATDGLGLDNGSTVLDIGCGYGAHTVALVERHGCRVVAVDPLELMLENAAAAVTSARLSDRVEFRRGVIGEIPARTDEFDFVWCRDAVGCFRSFTRPRRVHTCIEIGPAHVRASLIHHRRIEPARRRGVRGG